jgi:flagellar basal-body rod protein FlgB
MLPFAGFDTSDVLTKAMKTAEINHRHIANNIANADTPHYNPAELDFQKSLKAALEGRGGTALRTSRPRHFDFMTHQPLFKELAILSKNDYNKVDLDEQIAKLNENTGKYTTYARLVNKRFEQAVYTLNTLGR